MKLRKSHTESHKHVHTDKTNAISIKDVHFKYGKKRKKYLMVFLSILKKESLQLSLDLMDLVNQLLLKLL